MTKRILPSATELAASLNMPKTTFPLRPDHTSIEALHLKRISTDLYRWQKETRQDAEVFHLQDGPPFANGDLHIGHALNKILKDIILRYKLMTGHQIRYEPGWDCHGLPIELKALQKATSETKHSTSLLRSSCKNFALEAISRQKEDMLKWGLMCDSESPSDSYMTMTPAYEARQLRVFASFVERGLIKVGTKPVHWSPSSRTALAEAELEYIDDHQSTAVFARYPIIGENNLYLLIWSTTPWTLPANKAIAINPRMEYVVVLNRNDQCKYVVAKSSLDRLPFRFDLVETIDVSKLLSLTYSSPFDVDKVNPVIAGEFVGEETGTGLVHIAPAYGMEDYLALPEPFDILNGDGTYSDLAPEFLHGQHIHGDGTKSVVEHLSASGHIIHAHPYLHRVPVDWRTKKPVIQRATRQLFISITDEVKQQIQEALNNDVSFHPASGRERLMKFINSRREWCISRQRKWGVPIPIFFRSDTNEPVLEPAIIKNVASIVELKGSDCWWSLPIKELLPEGYKHLSENLVKGQDTMDVWFDSGTAWSHRGQADVYLEGSDQYRGWFQSSLITSIVATGKSPFRRLISHGFVVDAKGNKMSKSIGNIVAPSAVITKPLTGKQPYGIDLLRAWVASTDFTKDVAIGDEIMANVAETQQKIRNTCRFMIGNLADFNPDTVPKPLWTIDRLVMQRTMELMKEIKENYSNLAFIKVMSSLSLFCSEDLSAFYFEIVKDRLYSEKADCNSRRSAQFALRTILSNLTRAFAPVLMILAEEIYQMAPQHFFQNHSLDDSIFHLPFPAILPIKSSGLSFEQCKEMRYGIQTVAKSNGEKPLQMALSINPEALGDLNIGAEELVELLGISKISTSGFEDGIPVALNGQQVNLTKTADQHKCPRCWMYYSAEPESLCPRCDAVLNHT